MRTAHPPCVRPAAGPTLDHMGKLVLLAFAVLLPTLAGGAILAAVRGFRRLEAAIRLGSTGRRRPSPSTGSRPGCGGCGPSWRRPRTSPAAPPGGITSLALRGAYLDTLGSACQRFGVSPPDGGDRARQAEIYRVEAALREHGLDVREAAVR